MPSIEFDSDTVRVSGPKQTDGSITVSFTLGEYQVNKAAAILLLPRDKVLKVKVTFDD